MLEAARTLGLRRLVCASSTTVYYPIFHRPHSQPITEDFAFHSVSERPGSLYAASKLAGEFFAQHYAQTFGLSIAVLRYSAVLGLWAGPNHSVPGRLMAELLGQGASGGPVHISDPLLMWRGGEDFIDAREVARANVAALDAPTLPSCVYTIASGRMSRFADFVDAARRLQPDRQIGHAPLPDTGFAGFTHAREVPFDVSRAKDELGFEAKHDLLDSMQAARRWVGD
jgi:UDP-glucose 4-epimerase